MEKERLVSSFEVLLQIFSKFMRNGLFSQHFPRVFPHSAPCGYLNFEPYREACFP